jgi:F0F1-type ATP synthase assembly protein I
MSEDNKNIPNARSYIQYSGIAAQMGITIAVFAFLGKYLDGIAGTDKLLTALLALFGVLLSLYFVIRQLNKPPQPPTT